MEQRLRNNPQLNCAAQIELFKDQQGNSFFVLLTNGRGNGDREAGTQVLDIFSKWDSLYIDYSCKLQKAQIDDVEE